MDLSCFRLDVSHSHPTGMTLTTKIVRNSGTRRPLALAVLVSVLAAVTASAQTDAKHIFWGKGSPSAPNPSSLSSDLIYHGGNAGDGAIGVETKPAVYLVFWGPDWANGFTTTDLNGQVFTSQTLQNYVQSFLSNLGGLPGRPSRRSTATMCRPEPPVAMPSAAAPT